MRPVPISCRFTTKCFNVEIARRYGVFGSQAIFVIDAHGRICWRHIAADGMEMRLDDLNDALRSGMGRDG
jgi:hypothetical protein